MARTKKLIYRNIAIKYVHMRQLKFQMFVVYFVNFLEIH